MSDARPVIVGMNNPYSSRPGAALMPAPEGSAGHRLWQMVNDVCGIGRYDWMRLTDRRNLLTDSTWDPVAAARESEGLWSSLEGRRVIVLGQSAADVLWLPRLPDLRWSEHQGVIWCSVPHPSGLNRWYNDPLNRIAVGLRLEEEVERARAAGAGEVDEESRSRPLEIGRHA